MSKKITVKKYYKVDDGSSSTNKVRELSEIPFGVWITTYSFEEISSMKWKEALKVSTRITGEIIDESVKDCCIFVYLDEANYDKEEYVQVTWDELMKECDLVEIITYE